MVEFDKAVNPFQVQGMIRDKRLFYGREDELRTAWGFLKNGMNVSVVGERRIGKSSLLWRIKETFPEQLNKGRQKGKIDIHYIDMELVDSEEEFDDRLIEILNIKGGGGEESGVSVRELEKALEKKPVILCLDEFDRTIDDDGFPEDFFMKLRGLSQQEGLTLVVATKVPLPDYFSEGKTSPFPNVFPVPIVLGELKEREAYELLREVSRLADRKAFEPDELKKALKTIDNRNPWNVQYLGWCMSQSKGGMDFNKMYADGIEKKTAAKKKREKTGEEVPEKSKPDEPVTRSSADRRQVAIAVLVYIFVSLTFFIIATKATGLIIIIVDFSIAALAAALFILDHMKTRRRDT